MSSTKFAHPAAKGNGTINTGTTNFAMTMTPIAIHLTCPIVSLGTSNSVAELDGGAATSFVEFGIRGRHLVAVSHEGPLSDGIIGCEIGAALLRSSIGSDRVTVRRYRVDDDRRTGVCAVVGVRVGPPPPVDQGKCPDQRLATVKP